MFLAHIVLPFQYSLPKQQWFYFHNYFSFSLTKLLSNTLRTISYRVRTLWIWSFRVYFRFSDTNGAPPFGAVRFAVHNNKWITVLILVRYGSRSNTNGSVRFALLTVWLKNGTVKKTENGTVRTRYGTLRTRYGHGMDTVRYGHGDKFGRTTVPWKIKKI